VKGGRSPTGAGDEQLRAVNAVGLCGPVASGRQAGDRVVLAILDAGFDFSFVAGHGRPGGHNHRTVDPAKLRHLRVDLWIIPIRLRDRCPQIIDHRGLGNPAQGGKSPLAGAKWTGEDGKIEEPAETAAGVSRAGNSPNERNRKASGSSDSDGWYLDHLEKDLMDLKILNGGKNFLIDQLRKEREGLINRVVDFSRQVGQLETQVRQLSAPPDGSEYQESSVTAKSNNN
jgi:hypothetical protein